MFAAVPLLWFTFWFLNGDAVGVLIHASGCAFARANWRRGIATSGQCSVQMLVSIAKWPTKQSTDLTTTDTVWVYRAFCFWALQISVAANLVIILCFSQVQISLPRTCHFLSQPFTSAHFVLFLFTYKFYWIVFLFMFHILRPEPHRPNSSGARVCLLTTRLALWELCVISGSWEQKEINWRWKESWSKPYV